MKHTTTGSPPYVAPEILDEIETRKGYAPRPIDVWSWGVTLYELLAGQGRTPFAAGEIQEIFAKIKAGQFRCPASFSAPLRSLLDKIFQTDPMSRLYFTDCAIVHALFCDEAKTEEEWDLDKAKRMRGHEGMKGWSSVPGIKPENQRRDGTLVVLGEPNQLMEKKVHAYIIDDQTEEKFPILGNREIFIDSLLGCSNKTSKENYVFNEKKEIRRRAVFSIVTGIKNDPWMQEESIFDAMGNLAVNSSSS